MAKPYPLALQPLAPASPTAAKGHPAGYRLVVAWLAFAVLMALFNHLNLDFRLADGLFALEGGQWSLRNTVLTQRIFHTDGRQLSVALGLLAIGGLLLTFFIKRLRVWRRPLAYLVLAVATSTTSIAMLKQVISMDCPWDLARYGGDRPFIGLFASRPAGLADNACFPAGHASAGYAWMALYFFCAWCLPRWRWAGLAAGLLLGLSFGFDQQLRGAHFLSHDLWTLMICGSWSYALAAWLLPASARPHPRPHLAQPSPLQDA